MLKLGLVGWGYWGRNYAKYLDTTIDASLDWVCDLRDEMLKDAKKAYPHFNITKDITDLVKNKVDGVILAVPASIHYKIASYFIEQNIPILIEKPLTNSLDSALKLKDLADKHNNKVLVGHTFLYNQATRWIHTNINKKYFGDLYYLEFKRQSYGPVRDDVNIAWDFAPHDVSLVTWFLNNALPETVQAIGRSYSRNDQQDIAIISLAYPNNVLVNINVAWLYPTKIRTATILGSKRMAVFEDTNQTEPVRVYNTALKYPSEKDPYGAAFLLGDILIPRIKPIDPLYTELKHFIEYIKGKEKPFTSIDDGVTNVLLLEAINKSLQKNVTVDFKSFAKGTIGKIGKKRK